MSAHLRLLTGMTSLEPSLRTLHIGDGPPTDGASVVSWSELRSLPSFIQYPLVTVRPEEGSEAAQSELLELLQAQLRAQRGVDTRIVWILNEFSVDVAAALKMGELVPLHGLAGGEVRNELDGVGIVEGDIVWAIAPAAGKHDMGRSWWTRADGSSEIMVAATTADTRRLLLPPFSGDPARAIHAQTAPILSGVPLRALAALLLGLWVIAAGSIVMGGRSAYRTGVADVADDRIPEYALPVPDVTAHLDSAWLSHSERMVTRVLAEYAGEMRGMTAELATGANAYELWRSGREAAASSYPGPLRYYWLALLSGDMGSAYRILREADDETDGLSMWGFEVTNTLWQSALESLHELDLDRGRLYTQMFLRTTQRMAQGASLYTLSTFPHRNITVARILDREFDAGRVFALCAQPEAASAFAYLIGGWGWGYDLPADDVQGLAEIRAENRARYCQGQPPAAVDYAALPTLSDHRGQPPATGYVSAPTAPCSLVPLECRYLDVRGALRAEVSTTTIDATLDFARECSYLSDDAVILVLAALTNAPGDTPSFIASADPGPLSMDRLAAVLSRCTSPARSDFYAAIDELLSELPCEQLSWDVSPAALTAASHDGLASLARRCGR